MFVLGVDASAIYLNVHGIFGMERGQTVLYATHLNDSGRVWLILHVFPGQKKA